MPIEFTDKYPVKFYFAIYYTTSEHFLVRQSLLAVMWYRAEKGKEKEKTEEEKVARFERRHLNVKRREKERNSGSSWHVSRLSVFTEIPCTLHPITFVTDYSAKVSHRARMRARALAGGRKLIPTNYIARINAVKWSSGQADSSSPIPRSHLGVHTCRSCALLHSRVPLVVPCGTVI